MARNSSIGYKGSLTLDRITGIRHDKGQRMTYVPVKKENKFPTSRKSMKTTPNKLNGEKYT
jgi:hypothetical protein